MSLKKERRDGGKERGGRDLSPVRAEEADMSADAGKVLCKGAPEGLAAPRAIAGPALVFRDAQRAGQDVVQEGDVGCGAQV